MRTKKIGNKNAMVTKVTIALKRIMAGIIGLLLSLESISFTVFAAELETAIKINDTTVTSVNDVDLDTPIYYVQLEEGITSYTFETPNEWYIRTADDNCYVTNSYIHEGSIDSAEWVNNISVICAHNYGLEYPFTEASIAEWLEDCGYSSIDEYIEADLSYTDADEYIETEFEGDYKNYWLWNAGVNEITDNSLDVLDYFDAYVPWEMFSKSSIQKDSSAQYNLLYFFSDIDQILNRKIDTEKAEAILLIQIGGFSSTDSVNKKALKNAIDEAESGKYYISNDRYNGKTTSKDGFWTDFQPVLKVAKDVCDNSESTQKQVDEATEKLIVATSNLIPATNTNLTVLYETIHYFEDYEPEGYYDNPDNFSLLTWRPFESEMLKAKEILSEMFDENGYATEKNISARQPEVDAIVEQLINAGNNLDKRVSKHTEADYINAIAGIKLYSERFNPENMSENDYSSGWDEFVSTREKALLTISNVGPFNYQMGETEFEAVRSAFTALRNACYKLVENKDKISVVISVVDNYAKQENKSIQNETTQELLVDSGTTLAQALKQVGVVNFGGSSTYQPAVYVNGILYYQSISGGLYGSYSYSSSSQYNNIVLKDGDVIVASKIAPPTHRDISESTDEMLWAYEVVDYIKYQQISIDNPVVTAGEAFTINVSAQNALPSTFEEKKSPVAGAKLFVGESNEDKLEAGKSKLTNDTMVVTDEEGNAALTLYNTGWTVINAFDLSEYGTFTNGPSILVYVENADNLTLVKTDLKNILSEYANDEKYPQTFFKEDDWISIQTALSEGFAGIESAEDSGAAYEAESIAQKTILQIQEQASEYNDRSKKQFDSYMNSLPEDVEKLDESCRTKIESLIVAHDSMTKYVLSKLTGVEISRYEAIKAKYDDGLPEAKEYKLSVSYDFTEVPEEDIETLQSMLDYLCSLDVYEDKNSGDLGGEKLAKLYTFNKSTPNPYRSDIWDSVEEVYGNEHIYFCQSPEYITHFLIRDTGSISGDGWKIKDTSQKVADNNYSYSRVYTVNGHDYEMREISFIGIDSSNVTNGSYQLFDFSNYLGKHDSEMTMYFPDNFASFFMPFDDVTAVISWGRVGGSESELADARETAIVAINSAYEGYNSDDYTEDGYSAITDAKNSGIRTVELATSVDEIAQARKAALAAMAAVSAKPVSGAPNVELPDFGSVVGKVYVCIENNTFPGGDFTGTIVSGMYNLCENDTMMTVILKALKSNGFTWTGTGSLNGDAYGITYLSSINKDGKKLGEFDGEAGSGWMGTLNDWFTNYGFNQFSVSNGKLENGDVINVVYTQNLGVDVGGTWSSSDTSLIDLLISEGTLSPTFRGSTTDYTLTISSSTANLKIVPTAANKNYLVKTFLNAYNKDSSYYKRTENIPVKSGDTIYVGVGEKSWPSMNNQGAEAIDYTGTKYVIRIYTNDANGINSRIDLLPNESKITYGNYQSYVEAVENIRVDYSNLSDKTGVDTTRLEAVESKIQFFAEIDNVKALLAAIPAADKLTAADKSKVEVAQNAYSKLSDTQKDYITVGDVEKYNAAVKWLAEQNVYVAPTIVGSDYTPVSNEIDTSVSVSGNAAEAVVTNKQIEDAVKSASNSGDDIVINVTETKNADNVEVVIPAVSAEKIVEESNASVNIETPNGAVSISNETLAEIVKAADGKEDAKIQIEINDKKVSDVKDAVIATKDAEIVEVKITVAGKPITDFGGNTLDIVIPVSNLFKNGEKYQVVEISSNGSEKILTGRCEVKDKKNVVVVKVKGLSTFVATPNAPLPFTDIEGSWAQKYIAYNFNNGIMNGVSKTEFAPEETLTRAMFITMLYRLEGAKNTAKNIFTDVEEGMWYTDAIAWAASKKIVSGVSATEFAPNEEITREEMAVMLKNYSDFKKYNTSNKADLKAYTDAGAVSAWAVDALKWANAEGIINGVSSTELMPSLDASRAEAATILTRFIINCTK